MLVTWLAYILLDDNAKLESLGKAEDWKIVGRGWAEYRNFTEYVSTPPPKVSLL
jgi:hypothetical protein